MNLQAMSELADFVETRDIHMGMFSNVTTDLEKCETVDECGTAGCIAGWCIVKNFEHFKATVRAREGQGRLSEINYAASQLGLSSTESYHLFTPDGCYGTQPFDVKQRALKILRGETPLTRDWLLS